MSHIDYITPFPMDEAFDKPKGWIPELRINENEFTKLLLERWPHTTRNGIIQISEDTFSYFYMLRTKAEDNGWELGLNYACLLQINRPSDEILASLCHIYRQCVPREYKVYLLGVCEIPLDKTENEILKIIIPSTT